MTVAEIFKSVKYITNDKGKKSAVVVDMEVWEQIVTLLEDLEDAEELGRARAVKEETIPWNIARKELNLEG
jgi:PHD/YefM family antitoxin component YafN of YafNO toxin-antitoxin module